VTMTARCSDCGIDYPASVTICRVCGDRTSRFPNQAYDPDWAAKVTAALNPAPVAWEDPVPQWRWSQLVKAGYPPKAAEWIAGRRDIDLHTATGLLAAGCALDVAVEILL
jgi:hypothetical protein